MNESPQSRSDSLWWGPYRIVQILRERPEGGCARGVDPGGAPVFVRWANAGAPVDARLGVVCEHLALSRIADRGVPEAIDLVRGPAGIASVTAWIAVAPAAPSTVSPTAPPDPERLAAFLCRVLARAHAAGWCHGDVRPENVVADAQGELHLADWEMARRPGDPAPPGSVGYAPPDAWEPGHTAAARNDWYAAAVCVEEARLGRRLFPGPLSEVLPAQAAHRLGDPAPCGAAHARLVAAANGGDCAGPGEAAALAGTLRGAQAVSLAVRSAGGSCAPTDPSAVLAASDDGECGTGRPDVQCRRVHLGRNAVALARVAGWVGARLAAAGASEHASRTDVLRSEWRRAIDEIAAALTSWGYVVCADAADLATGGERRRVADSLAERGIEVLESDAEPPLRSDPARERAVEESLAAQALGVRVVPEDLMRHLRAAALPDAAAAHAEIERLLAAGAVLRDARGWRLVPGATGSTASVPATAVRRPDDAAPSVEEVLDHGERSVACGDTAAGYRAAVRATTAIAEADGGAPDVVLRVAELWLELGRSDACEHVLDSWGHTVSELRRLALTARARLAAGEAGGLDPIGLRMLELATGADDLVTAHRVLAVAAIGRRDTAAAAHHLRLCARSRRQARAWVQVEYTVTLANWARLSGKLRSAQRLLRRNAVRADDLGALRLAATCRINALLGEQAGTSSTRATSWEQICDNAERWGLSSQAAYAGAFAARSWIEAGETARAARLVDSMWTPAKLAGAPSVWLQNRILDSRACVLDRHDRFGELLATIAASPSSPHRAALSQFLRDEWEGDPGFSRPAVAPRQAADEVRVAALCVRGRVTSRGGSARVRRLLETLDSTYLANSGLAVHGTRAVVTRWRRSPEEICAAAREAASAEDDHVLTATLAVAAVALVLAWRAEPVSDASVAWFLDRASADVETRPAGVRTWEWHLAHAVAWESVRADSAEAAEARRSAVAALVEFARALPAHLVPAFVRRVRGANWYWLPPGGAGALEPSAWEGPAEAVAFARELSAPFTGTGHRSKRERDLERVLRCALRLRSGTSVEDVLTEAVGGVLDVCGAERSVVLYEVGGGPVRAKVATRDGVAEFAASEAECSRSVLLRVRDAAGAVVIDDASAEEGLGSRPSVRRFRPRSLLVCPMRTTTRYLGYLYVENRSRPGSFDRGDAELLEGFAAQVALALENASLVEDLRTSYRDLSQARTEAVRAESLRVLGRMATDVAHDLNNVLTAIMGESQLLLGDDRFRDAYSALRVIERAAEDGAEYIRRIQDSTRVRTAEQFEAVDLSRLVRDVLDLTRIRCRTNGGGGANEIRVDAVLPREAVVRGSASELREVVTNVVVNAIEAMPDGGDLRVQIVRRDDSHVIEVADTGCGIAPETQARLFEPFFTTKGDRGNGLGLSIAQGVVRRHGGEIEVLSEVGRGTTMSIRLPRLSRGVEIESDTGETRAAPAAVAEAVRRRFLIVDDDPSVLRVLGQLLRRVGADVEQVVGGDAARSRIRAAPGAFDCVITDLYMPDVSGLDVADAVREACPDTDVVLMSGCATTLETAASQKRGIHTILRKPFGLDAVRRLVGSGR